MNWLPHLPSLPIKMPFDFSICPKVEMNCPPVEAAKLNCPSISLPNTPQCPTLQCPPPQACPSLSIACPAMVKCPEVPDIICPSVSAIYIL